MAANRNLLKPADGSPILHIEQDIVLGCYYLTYQKPGVKQAKPRPYSDADEAIMAFDAESLGAARNDSGEVPRRNTRDHPWPDAVQ